MQISGNISLLKKQNEQQLGSWRLWILRYGFGYYRPLLSRCTTILQRTVVDALRTPIIFGCICAQQCTLRHNQRCRTPINNSTYNESKLNVLWYLSVTLQLQTSFSHILVVQVVHSLAQYHKKASANLLCVRPDHKTFSYYCTRDLLVQWVLDYPDN